KANPSARADDQDCSHRVMLLLGPAWLSVMCGLGSHTARWAGSFETHSQGPCGRMPSEQKPERSIDFRTTRLRFHSRRARKRSCGSMSSSSICARSNPARALVGLLVWSLAIRRSAASTRSFARSKSTTVYCRGSGRVRFPRRRFDAFLATTVALNLGVAMDHSDSQATAAHNQTYSAELCELRRSELWAL